MEAAGLEYVNPHGLRHSFTSILMGSAVPVTVVSANLGHADPSTTLRIYSHIFTQQRGVAGAAMTQAFAAT
jgi:integrase